MGVHRVPKGNPLLGFVPVKQAMSLNRFRAVRRYIHFDDNRSIIDSSDIASKVKTFVLYVTMISSTDKDSDGTLKHNSAPPLLPAYNKYMGGVARTGQMRKVYGYDRKSLRYWLSLFFHLLVLAIGNRYELYRHECKAWYAFGFIYGYSFRAN